MQHAKKRREGNETCERAPFPATLRTEGCLSGKDARFHKISAVSEPPWLYNREDPCI